MISLDELNILTGEENTQISRSGATFETGIALIQQAEKNMI